MRPCTPAADCSLNGTVVGTYGTMGRYEVKYDKAGTYYYKCGGATLG